MLIGSAPNQVWVWRNLKLQYFTSDATDATDHFISSQAEKSKEEVEYRRSEASEASVASNKLLEDYSDAT